MGRSRLMYVKIMERRNQRASSHDDRSVPWVEWKVSAYAYISPESLSGNDAIAL